MSLNFKPLSLEVMGDYNAMFHLCPGKTSDYTFVNIWAWSDDRQYELALAHEMFWPRIGGSSPALWAPVGDWNRADWEETLPELFPGGAEFERVPEELALSWADLFGDRVVLDDQRSEWEYVYSVEELINLQGNRFHKKKNLWRQFYRSYDSVYKELGPGDADEILEMQQLWCEWKSCDDIPGFRAENHAVYRVLKNWQHFPELICGAIYVGENMVAYTVGEPMGDDMAIIHFEKGLGDYKGVYQAINQAFLEKSCSRFEWVNREQDMGEEGLRQAKESYNPVKFLKKYRVIWKG